MAKVVFAADIQAMRGKMGNSVFSRARNGNTVRTRVKGKNPRTSAQTGVRSNFSKAATSYKNMTPAQVSAWQVYAAGQIKHDSLSGLSYVPSGNTVFVGLAAKFLQINPTGTVPVTPPTAAFSGDSITVTAAGSSGKVIFTGSGNNSANIKTELLLQPLKSQNRAAANNGYRSKGFIAFAGTSLAQNVTVPAGFYVPAYRFVNTLTGQESLLVTLPVAQAT